MLENRDKPCEWGLRRFASSMPFAPRHSLLLYRLGHLVICTYRRGCQHGGSVFGGRFLQQRISRERGLIWRIKQPIINGRRASRNRALKKSRNSDSPGTRK